MTACSEPVHLGEAEIEAEKVDLVDVCTNYELFADETVHVEGVILDGVMVDSREAEYEMGIFPVGFRIPDSLIGGKGHCIGTIIYQEETEKPGLAVLSMEIHVPRRRGNP